MKILMLTATVSTGAMGVEWNDHTSKPASQATLNRQFEGRLRNLEGRVKALENKARPMKQPSAAAEVPASWGKRPLGELERMYSSKIIEAQIIGEHEVKSQLIDYLRKIKRMGLMTDRFQYKEKSYVVDLSRGTLRASDGSDITKGTLGELYAYFYRLVETGMIPNDLVLQ